MMEDDEQPFSPSPATCDASRSEKVVPNNNSLYYPQAPPCRKLLPHEPIPSNSTLDQSSLGYVCVVGVVGHTYREEITRLFVGGCRLLEPLVAAPEDSSESPSESPFTSTPTTDPSYVHSLPLCSAPIYTKPSSTHFILPVPISSISSFISLFLELFPTTKDILPRLAGKKGSHVALKCFQMYTHDLPPSHIPAIRTVVGVPRFVSFQKYTAQFGDCSPDNTRFLYIAGLGESSNPALTAYRDSLCACFSAFDTSSYGCELFIPKNKPFFYVGFRSSLDSSAALVALHGETVSLSCDAALSSAIFPPFTSSKLYVDRAYLPPPPSENDLPIPDPNALHCTSTTSHISIPGLIVIPDFISVFEESVLLATLCGPEAPWSVGQERPSGGIVRRRVQHYGYVFDYATGDILRDPVGRCPPLPSAPAPDPSDAASATSSAAKNAAGRTPCGWSTMGEVLARTRVDPRISSLTEHANQVTVNEYPPGQGIGSHIDTITAFSEGLVSISMGGGVVMEFREVDTSKGDEPTGRKKQVYLPPRSLLLMSGDARFKWEHSISSRKTDTVEGVNLKRDKRISLTVRTGIDLLGSPLPRIETMQFPPKTIPAPPNTVASAGASPLVVLSSNGDSSAAATDTGNKTSSFASSSQTPSCERLHVHALYDSIALQWHHTRGKRGILWPRCSQFLESLPRFSIVADVGCGDGKYRAAAWQAGHYMIGSDISLELLKCTLGSTGGGKDVRQVAFDESGASKRPEVFGGDCLNIAMRSGSVDAAICIAVMHHLSSVERRLQCLRELGRIVKDGGLIDVQAWAMDQEADSKRKFASQDIFVPFKVQPRYLEKYTPGEDPSTVYEGATLDETSGLVVFERYCHVYTPDELSDLASQIEGLEVLERGFDSGNHYIRLKVHK